MTNRRRRILGSIMDNFLDHKTYVFYQEYEGIERGEVANFFNDRMKSIPPFVVFIDSQAKSYFHVRLTFEADRLSLIGTVVYEPRGERGFKSRRSVLWNKDD
ncbi:MAG: hypothetical protein KGJ90_02470 [Patescibacteria group bacterium]|nr:hypothetical protein [Patescibacteria group bacterium]